MYNDVDHDSLLEIILPFVLFCLQYTDYLLPRRSEPAIANILNAISMDYNFILNIFYKKDYFLSKYKLPVTFSSKTSGLNPHEINTLRTLVKKKEEKLSHLLKQQNVL